MHRIDAPYTIPYYAQVASPELAQAIFGDGMPAQEDPRWAESGAKDPEEYAYWTDRACGVACVKMVVEAFGGPVNPLVAWARAGVELGGYLTESRQDGSLAERGWLHAALATLITRAGFFAEPRAMEIAEFPDLFTRGYLLIASVSYQIGTRLPITRRGGHLVVVSGAEMMDEHLEAIYVQNPSGRTAELRSNARIPVGRFASGYTGRVIVTAPNQIN
jgi:hypothetical protein